MRLHDLRYFLQLVQSWTLQTSFEGAQVGAAGNQGKVLLGQVAMFPNTLQRDGKGLPQVYFWLDH